MKYIFLNLKRFDIPPERGGVNRISSPDAWGRTIIQQIQSGLSSFEGCNCTVFLPEAHILPALSAINESANLYIGCQGVYKEDTEINGNFGAFTTNLPSNAAVALGCEWTLIGHCEERLDKKKTILLGGGEDLNAVNKILNMEIKCAVKAGLKVLYCIGEAYEELETRDSVLKNQLETGLEGVDRENIVIAYEPVWAIGPGKTPPDKAYITETAELIKQITNGLPVVYGGGLKLDNAAMLASINELDGGLIALTRFSGEIGFYPDEFIEIVTKYMEV